MSSRITTKHAKPKPIDPWQPVNLARLSSALVVAKQIKALATSEDLGAFFDAQRQFVDSLRVFEHGCRDHCFGPDLPAPVRQALYALWYGVKHARELELPGLVDNLLAVTTRKGDAQKAILKCLGKSTLQGPQIFRALSEFGYSSYDRLRSVLAKMVKAGLLEKVRGEGYRRPAKRK